MKPKHHLHGSLRLFLLHIIESNLELFTQIKMQQWKKAAKKVFTESYHGLCTLQIMRNAVKHLSPIKGNEEEEGEKEVQEEVEEEDEESHILKDFSARMYGYEDKAEFQEAFDIMRSKVHK